MHEQGKMEYTPVNLELETDEFREKLEFFRTAFIFERDQMHVFIKTLTDRLAAIRGSADESDDEEGEGEDDQLEEAA